MKTTFQYDHYFQYAELKKDILFLAKKYPQLCQAEIICVTAEKRNVYALTLSSPKNGGPAGKPALYIDGNTHAGEVTGSMAAMHTADYLLTGYGMDPAATQALDQYTVYVIPRVSPDGAETYLSTPYTLRSVDRVYKEEKGGVQEQDLDHDGVIRMMRIPTPYGAWKKDPANEGSMISRQPDDTAGEFFDIYPEGTLEDPSAVNLHRKKSAWGLDFNRNYPYGWCPDAKQPGAGKYPLSNPENKAVVDFVLGHPNIGAVATHHTSGGVILYPPGTRKASAVSKDDISAFLAIGRMGQQEMGYEPINIFDTFLDDQQNVDSGAFDDWCYQAQGIPAYTIELWDLAKRAGVPVNWGSRTEETAADQIKRFNACMAWVKKNAPQEYQDWQPFHHPVFGLVELGGFNYKLTHQNPPQAFLLQEVEKTTKFMLRYLKALPKLTMETPTVKDLGDGLYEIKAVVGNTGFLPTNLTDEAVHLKTNVPVSVTLDVPAKQLLKGQPQETIGDLSGYSRTKTGVYFYGNITTETSAPSRHQIVWLVRGKPGTVLHVTAAGAKAGSCQAEITL